MGVMGFCTRWCQLFVQQQLAPTSVSCQPWKVPLLLHPPERLSWTCHSFTIKTIIPPVASIVDMKKIVVQIKNGPSKRMTIVHKNATKADVHSIASICHQLIYMSETTFSTILRFAITLFKILNIANHKR